MQITITGGAGFIGRYVCDQLLAGGHDVVLLDLVAPDWPTAPPRVVQGDIRDPHAVHEALRGSDGLLHLAAAHHDFGIAPETYFDVNEGGARVLCEAMDANQIRRACFYSSVAVYGGAPEPLDERARPEPLTPYGRSKLAGEAVFQSWADQGLGRSVLIIRPSATFGPRNFANMYSLIRQIASGRFLMVGKGDNIKSLAYVDNLVTRTLRLWEQQEPGSCSVYNYVDKPDLTSADIVATIYGALGKRPPHLRVPYGLARALALPFDAYIGLTGRNVPISTARITKFAGTQSRFEAEKIDAAVPGPTVSLRDGIARMVDWYQREGSRLMPTWQLPPATVTPSRPPVLNGSRR